MAIEVSVGPPLITINRGNTFVLCEPDGSVTAYTVIGADTLFSGADIVGGVPTGPSVIASIGPESGTFAASGSVAPGSQSDPYSITLVQVFTLSPNGNGISTDQRVTVPDGGNTLMLLGSALSVLGLCKFRSRKA